MSNLDNNLPAELMDLDLIENFDLFLSCYFEGKE